MLRNVESCCVKDARVEGCQCFAKDVCRRPRPRGLRVQRLVCEDAADARARFNVGLYRSVMPFVTASHILLRIFIKCLCIKCHFVYEVYHSTGISKGLSRPKSSNSYIHGLYDLINKLEPDISSGWERPMTARTVGATSPRTPSLFLRL